ncbi:MAG: protein-L-isoaspartate O-methyltransferase [Hyphomicrobiales bacterium]|nr:protein-L-isoaspartate O-methyltransferase [Hyphomicrobiales bacterium]MDE2113976.1 protein-L-isoaspartate O-methyltransferase [Hyphomicrobiales bacterium]
MVDGQIRTFDVTNHPVLDRFYEVPRELFVDDKLVTLAYSDGPLTLAGTPPRQLLPPMVLARMMEAAQIKPGDRVLDVGGGNGYSAAILSGLAAKVVALESSPERCDLARKALQAAGISNVECVSGALVEGYVKGGRYDVILLNGAYGAEPAKLLGQLAQGGRLVAIHDNGSSGSSAILLQNNEHIIGQRLLFNAKAPVLEGFANAPAFVF